MPKGNIENLRTPSTEVAQDIRRFIFVDKAFELDKNDETEFNELIEHFKYLKERLKLQNIGEDFK